MNNDNDRDKDKDRDGRSEVLNAALVEVEKAMARENAPTRNTVLVKKIKYQYVRKLRADGL